MRHSSRRASRSRLTTSAATRTLSPIRPSGDLQPLVLFHASCSGAEAYRDLPSLMDTGIPVFAVDSYHMLGGRPLIERIDELAAVYLKVLKKALPKGPWFLGGWSLGGILAMEAAAQLVEIDEAPIAVYMIDSEVVDAEEKERLMRLGREDRLAALALEPSFAKLPPEYQERMVAASLAESHAIARHRPKPYSGAVILFKATRELRLPPGVPDQEQAIIRQRRKIASPDLGWGPYLRNLRTVPVEGDHYTVMHGDAMTRIAAEIQSDILERVREASDSSDWSGGHS